MNWAKFRLYESGRQSVNHTAHKRKSIWERARLILAPMPKLNKTQEIERRKRQIERGIIKIG